jgi:ADP-ribose pyrophosphatase YjhB (NUDIX family)
MSIPTSPVNRSSDISRLADELRALSNAGLMFTQDPYQIERYERIIEISAELTSFVNGSSAVELRKAFFADMHYITPYSVVDTAVFNEAGELLLIQRADDGHWALPGGACSVGEVPATGAAREVWEETACVVEIGQLLGVFDSRSLRETTLHHLYIFLFSGRIIEGAPRVTSESRDVRWFAADEIPWDALSSSHGVRIRQALKWYADPAIPVHFEIERWQPMPSFQHRVGSDDRPVVDES